MSASRIDLRGTFAKGRILRLSPERLMANVRQRKNLLVLRLFLRDFRGIGSSSLLLCLSRVRLRPGAFMNPDIRRRERSRELIPCPMEPHFDRSCAGHANVPQFVGMGRPAETLFFAFESRKTHAVSPQSVFHHDVRAREKFSARAEIRCGRAMQVLRMHAKRRSEV